MPVRQEATVKSLKKCRSINAIDGKGKALPRTGHKGPEGEQRYSSTLSLTLALDGGWVVNCTRQPLYPREKDQVPVV